MNKTQKGVTFNHNPLLRSELPAWRPRRSRSSPLRPGIDRSSTSTSAS